MLTVTVSVGGVHVEASSDDDYEHSNDDSRAPDLHGAIVNLLSAFPSVGGPFRVRDTRQDQRCQTESPAAAHAGQQTQRWMQFYDASISEFNEIISQNSIIL